MNTELVRVCFPSSKPSFVSSSGFTVSLHCPVPLLLVPTCMQTDTHTHAHSLPCFISVPLHFAQSPMMQQGPGMAYEGLGIAREASESHSALQTSTSGVMVSHWKFPPPSENLERASCSRLWSLLQTSSILSWDSTRGAVMLLSSSPFVPAPCFSKESPFSSSAPLLCHQFIDLSTAFPGHQAFIKHRLLSQVDVLEEPLITGFEPRCVQSALVVLQILETERKGQKEDRHHRNRQAETLRPLCALLDPLLLFQVLWGDRKKTKYEGVEAWLFLLSALDLVQGPRLVTAEAGCQFLEPFPLPLTVHVNDLIQTGEDGGEFGVGQELLSRQRPVEDHLEDTQHPHMGAGQSFRRGQLPPVGRVLLELQEAGLQLLQLGGGAGLPSPCEDSGLLMILTLLPDPSLTSSPGREEGLPVETDFLLGAEGIAESVTDPLPGPRPLRSGFTFSFSAEERGGGRQV
ncbi:hypothetical protein F7725_018041 [Dissostichus mawsoni]|uniref:Uncharacterized protein n=1 Tax=Dissostichus mawsoni TaxID=36200 RepID=A0A7J5XQF7_DISMA|nr:hypothetical protein F7725_018041 [Dissostichus mawsoni]